MDSKGVKRIIDILNVLLIVCIAIYCGLRLYNARPNLDFIILIEMVFAVIIIAISIYQAIYKTKKYQSIKTLGEHIEKWRDKSWFQDKYVRADVLAKEFYIKTSISYIIVISLVVIVTFLMLSKILKISNMDILVFFVVMFLILLIRIMIIYKAAAKICNVLYEDCDPYTSIIAFYKIMTIARGLQFEKRDNYKLFVSNMLFFTGDFEFTIQFIDMMENERKNKKKNNFFFQSEYIRFLCFINMKEYEKAEKIMMIFEDEIKNNPKLEKSKMIKAIMPKMKNNIEFIQGNYDKVKELCENTLKETTAEHQRVSCQYRLLQVDLALGNEEAAEKRKEYILTHGKDLFYVSKCDSQG